MRLMVSLPWEEGGLYASQDPSFHREKGGLYAPQDPLSHGTREACWVLYIPPLGYPGGIPGYIPPRSPMVGISLSGES